MTTKATVLTAFIQNDVVSGTQNTFCCVVQYDAGRKGLIKLYMKSVLPDKSDEKSWQEIMKGATEEVLLDVLYDCVTEKETKTLLYQTESKTELSRMIREAIQEQVGTIDEDTLQILSLEVTSNA